MKNIGNKSGGHNVKNLEKYLQFRRASCFYALRLFQMVAGPLLQI